MKKWQQLVCAMFVGVFVLGGVMVQPALAQPDDMMPGSFLIFPIFDIRSNGGTRNQTRIRITNNGVVTTDVHLTAICPGKTQQNDGVYDPHCAATDRKITLTPHQTAILEIGTPFVLTGATTPSSNNAPVYEFGFPAPCPEGYIIAYAQTAPNPTTGAVSAISYNSLYGDYQIIYNPDSAIPGGAVLPTGPTVEAAPAIAIQSNQPAFAILGAQRPGGLLDLSFGPPPTADYNAIPTYLLADFAAIGGTLSPGPLPGAPGFLALTEIDTRIILLALDVLADGNNPYARAGFSIWDAKENPFSASRNFICWTRFSGAAAGLGGVFTKSTAGGALDADYGSFRVALTDGGGNLTPYNPAGFGAIEEVSSLGVGGPRGNTIRNLHHTVGNKSTVITVDTLNPGP